MGKRRRALGRGAIALAAWVALGTTGSATTPSTGTPSISTGVPPRVFCVPPPFAWIIETRGRPGFVLPARTTRCYWVAPDSGRILRRAAPRIPAATRVVLHRGDKVQFRLLARPLGDVRLQVTRSGSTRTYHLRSVRNPVWRVRGTGGSMVLTASLSIAAPGGRTFRRTGVYRTGVVIR